MLVFGKWELCAYGTAFKTPVLIYTDYCHSSAFFANGKKLPFGCGQWLLRRCITGQAVENKFLLLWHNNWIFTINGRE